jgi:two-component system sensor histidine kinase KdpD
LPLLEIDFRLFEHAISNLILNATLYSPLETEIILSVSVENEKLCFTIDDSGPGIPQADHERIFEKFYRVPGSPPGGTGLGLSIAKSIVDLHRGEIRVENRASGGARFIIELPVGQPPGVPDEPAS